MTSRMLERGQWHRDADGWVHPKAKGEWWSIEKHGPTKFRLFSVMGPHRMAHRHGTFRSWEAAAKRAAQQQGVRS